MRTNDQPSSRTISGFHLHLGAILGDTMFETPVERDRPARPRPIAGRSCDGCGESAPTVDLWAEDSETGEQIWLCTACGD